MTNHFRIIAALPLIVLVSGSLCARPKDVAGWQRARWGMSESALLNVFGSKLKKLPERQAFVWLHVDYVIPDFSLDGNAYTVFLHMETVLTNWLRS